VKPSGVGLLLVTVWLGLAVLAAVRPEAAPMARIAGWLLLGAGALDLLLAWRLPMPELRRRVQGTLALGVWTEVKLRLINPDALPRRVRVFDGTPSEGELRGLPRDVRVPGGGHADFHYRWKPRRRGTWTFEPAHLQIASPLQLWWLLRRGADAHEVRVYPNFAEVKKYAALATGHRLTMLGVHQRRRRGEGSEFHQLREYRDGDSLRQIDWKATARMRRLISREYQEERDQQVVLVLDCGRRMRAMDGELSHFDHSLNSALLLAHVALRDGDAVGLMSFAGDDRWVPPGKGAPALNRMLEALFDLEPSLSATDYLAAAERLMTRLRKRSLVVIITNLRDEDDDTLAPAMAMLRRRHRVLLASLRERELDEALAKPVRDLDEALLHGAIHEYLDQRRLAFQHLASQGLRALDLLPDQLPLALVNRYLELKRAGLM
jgi:uncharacterized protein (DUF58 family)